MAQQPVTNPSPIGGERISDLNKVMRAGAEAQDAIHLIVTFTGHVPSAAEMETKLEAHAQSVVALAKSTGAEALIPRAQHYSLTMDGAASQMRYAYEATIVYPATSLEQGEQLLHQFSQSGMEATLYVAVPSSGKHK